MTALFRRGDENGSGADSNEGIPKLSSEEDLHRALRAPRALLFKHSPICWGSTVALKELDRFRERSPEVPVYLIDVVGERELSRSVAETLGVPHESPQVILVGAGEVLWHDSHYAVTAGRIAAALESEAGG